jgi:putative ABC transport system ATP-binding protein
MSAEVRVEPVLEASGLTHSFGDGAARTVVLRDVALQLFPGEVSLIVGPSGSGKSTLLAILSGLMRPESGQVLALGYDLGLMGDADLKAFRRCFCGFIFQGYNLFPALTARRHLEMVLRWGLGIPRREARWRADQMLAALGLDGKGGLRPDQLSGGEKQRVAIGRALIKGPALCFADEPTSALDWGHGRQAVELLCAAARQWGSTILVVSHDPRIVDYADRVFHLEDGSLGRPAASTQLLRSTR